MIGLQLRNVSKSFGAVKAVKSLDICFDPGKVTAIVGDNGAGKSVLLKLLAGLLEPETGSIRLGSCEIKNLSAASRRRLGIEMVYQDLALACQQDVITNLFMGREVLRNAFGFLDRKEMARKAREVLDRIRINIPDLCISVGSLSGGQQQAIAIARAILFDPKVLLLDEPTAALGAREIQDVLSFIKQQKEIGRIVVFVSHRLNDVFAVADRIVVMRQGCIVEDQAAALTTLEKIVASIVG